MLSSVNSVQINSKANFGFISCLQLFCCEFEWKLCIRWKTIDFFRSFRYVFVFIRNCECKYQFEQPFSRSFVSFILIKENNKQMVFCMTNVWTFIAVTMTTTCDLSFSTSVAWKWMFIRLCNMENPSPSYILAPSRLPVSRFFPSFPNTVHTHKYISIQLQCIQLSLRRANHIATWLATFTWKLASFVQTFHYQLKCLKCTLL